MKKNTSALIGALILTAILLGVVLISNSSRPAEASMLNDQPSFSLMTAGVVGNDEAIIVIDKAQQKMIVYTLLGNNFNPIAGYDFGHNMGPVAPGK